jgi:hypothetical protein
MASCQLALPALHESCSDVDAGTPFASCCTSLLLLLLLLFPPCCCQVVGEGFHPKAGMPHAEVYALRAAGGAGGINLAQGFYLLLCPCLPRLL